MTPVKIGAMFTRVLSSPPIAMMCEFLNVVHHQCHVSSGTTIDFLTVQRPTSLPVQYQIFHGPYVAIGASYPISVTDLPLIPWTPGEATAVLASNSAGES